MHPALQLEEVRAAIGAFLSPSSLIACASCCHEWHDSFLPLIWRHLHIHHHHRIPLKLLEKNKQRILQLTVQNRDTPPYFTIVQCSRLSHLNIKGSKYMYYQRNPDQWRSWILLVQNHNSTLQHVSLLNFRHIDITPEFCTAVGTCAQLQSLTIEGNIPRLSSFFWDACGTINTLKMKNSTFPLRHNGITTRIHRVVIEEPLSAANVVEFLGMCPELRYLYWRSSKMIRFPLPQLASALMDGLWPRLTELDVDGNEMKDDDLAKALDGIGQLVSLRAPKAEFSSLSLQSIRKHISSIKTLDLRGCNYVTSSMIQSILCSMITLESLSVGRIGYMDIVTGSAWTSLNLRELAISIDMDTISSDKSKEKTLTRSDTSGSPSFEAHQRIVYGRLSSLERLSVLNLQPYPLNNYATMKRTLDLRLISGLEVLSSLKKLVDFSFKMTSQQMSMDEVQWITRNWTSLRKICGRFTSDPVQYYEMKRALNRYGILVYD